MFVTWLKAAFTCMYFSEINRVFQWWGMKSEDLSVSLQTLVEHTHCISEMKRFLFFLAFNLRCLDSNEPVTWLSLDHHPLSCFQAGCRNILSPSKLKRKRCQPACTSNVKKKNWMWLKVLGKNCNRLAQNHPSLTENSEGYVHGTNSPQYWENRRDSWFNESLLNFSK